MTGPYDGVTILDLTYDLGRYATRLSRILARGSARRAPGGAKEDPRGAINR